MAFLFCFLNFGSGRDWGRKLRIEKMLVKHGSCFYKSLSWYVIILVFIFEYFLADLW